ncbi:MAG: hypothetical protein GWP45_09920 [Proteobacteria bacterium]|nr:hypothetical protein [Pseudomonadota bacterium]
MTFRKTEQFASFIKLAGDISATRILELGTIDSAFLSEFLRHANWSSSISLHCVDTGSETFDSELMKAAASNDAVEFNLVKHIGSETEVNDAVLMAAKEELFDMVLVSGASSQPSLLTACMVCNEIVRTGGTVAIAEAIMESGSMAEAVQSFSDIFEDSFDECQPGIYTKK